MAVAPAAVRSNVATKALRLGTGGVVSGIVVDPANCATEGFDEVTSVLLASAGPPLASAAVTTMRRRRPTTRAPVSGRMVKLPSVDGTGFGAGPSSGALGVADALHATDTTVSEKTTDRFRTGSLPGLSLSRQTDEGLDVLPRVRGIDRRDVLR